MKNPMEVLRSKEQELIRVRKEVEALRVAAHLLDDDSQNGNDNGDGLHHLIEMP